MNKNPDFFKRHFLPVWAAAACSMTLLVSSGAHGEADDAGTLRLDADGQKVVMYLPEVDFIKESTVTARSAFSVSGLKETPVFGAARYTAEIEKKKGKVTLSSIHVEDVKLPKNGGKSARLMSSLNEALQGASWTVPASRFEARLAPGADGADRRNFNTKAPKIFYENQPAVLVFVDGEPILKDTEDGHYKYVVNTAYFIAFDPEDNCFYLKGGKWWYRAKRLKGEWIVTVPPPEPIRRSARAALEKGARDTDRNIAELENPPKIILSTAPAELIVVNGAPDYVSIEGTELLYVDNTESNVLVDVRSQLFYILIAGRWYASPSIKGPWAFVPPDRLPEDFSKIPFSSNASDVRVSVPGTLEAEEATLIATVPEISEVDRGRATVSVSFDGPPKFRRIAGTRVSYAMNASTVVLKIRGRYFAVDNGIWFKAAAGLRGPWVVAAAVPPEVDEIPPSAPVYHVRYVHIYDRTPDVVYVGYTPGYYSSYVYRGTVVYGTGFRYRPWRGALYHPFPVTFGFGAHYNPYTGLWGYPGGVTFGWLNLKWSVNPLGFWGPAGYLFGYRHGYYHRRPHGHYRGHRHGYLHGYSAGRPPGFRAAPGGHARIGAPHKNRGPSGRRISGFHREGGVSPRAAAFSTPNPSHPRSHRSDRAGRPIHKRPPANSRDGAPGRRIKRPMQPSSAGDLFKRTPYSDAESRRPRPGSRHPSHETRRPKSEPGTVSRRPSRETRRPKSDVAPRRSPEEKGQRRDFRDTRKRTSGPQSHHRKGSGKMSGSKSESSHRPSRRGRER